MDEETIAAISTPIGEGAIGIVRLSGPEAIAVVDELYRGRKPLAEAGSHTIHYGKIADSDSGQVIDEVMVSVMKKPNTFTREDVVEINCHGGLLSVRRVLGLVLDHGARLAEPGEFTKRAFLNGRIDLSQAEAVMDLIRAKTDRAMHAAMNQMEGYLSKHVHLLREQLLDILAAVEVNVDYPEYDDAEIMTGRMLVERASAVGRRLSDLLATAKQGRILREGLSTVIVGRPNVGKSSLLNRLANENKAIVTDVPGTTRDIIEEYINIHGIPVKLVDTAGIRETEDRVEKIGVARSRKVLKDADLILFVLNGNEPLGDEDRRLFQSIASGRVLIVVNKSDLPLRLDLDELKALAGEIPVVRISLLRESGIEEVEDKIASLFFDRETLSGDATYVMDTRHIMLIKQAKAALDDAVHAAEAGFPVDIAQIDVKRAWQLLGEIVGDTVSDRLIQELFSKFCLGK